jgi:hypothetical protein
MTTERTPERVAEDRELIEKAIRDYVTFEYHAIGSKKSVQRVQDALAPLPRELRVVELNDGARFRRHPIEPDRLQYLSHTGDMWCNSGDTLANLAPVKERVDAKMSLFDAPFVGDEARNAPPLRQEDWVVMPNGSVWNARRRNIATGAFEYQHCEGWKVDDVAGSDGEAWRRRATDTQDSSHASFCTAVADMLDRWSARDHRSGRTPTAEQCRKEKP